MQFYSFNVMLFLLIPRQLFDIDLVGVGGCDLVKSPYRYNEFLVNLSLLCCECSEDKMAMAQNVCVLTSRFTRHALLNVHSQYVLYNIDHQQMRFVNNFLCVFCFWLLIKGVVKAGALIKSLVIPNTTLNLSFSVLPFTAFFTCLPTSLYVTSVHLVF